jgi:Cu(I)/Ag(I) efflux system membrane fusion protein
MTMRSRHLTPAADQASAGAGQGRILYYRNPMGVPDVSPVPKKHSMGME